MDSGDVIFRDADYFGRAVNTLARVTDFARPEQLLMTSASADLVDPALVELTPIGKVMLKGLSAPVTPWLAASRQPAAWALITWSAVVLGLPELLSCVRGHP